MRRGFAFMVAALLAAILGAGCAGTTGGAGGIDAAIGDMPSTRAIAGDFNSIAVTDIRCNERTEACAKSHAAKGDACLRLAIEQPQSASAQDNKMRRLLDCAETGYRKALALQPQKSAPSRVSYHGGLLLTLSERRNRLDDVREKKLDRENEKLLMAARDARREVPGSALGFLYGASAHVYRATLSPQGRARCSDLRQAELMLQRSPPPPRELVEEQRRISSLVQRTLRSNGCPRISRV